MDVSQTGELILDIIAPETHTNGDNQINIAASDSIRATVLSKLTDRIGGYQVTIVLSDHIRDTILPKMRTGQPVFVYRQEDTLLFE